MVEDMHAWNPNLRSKTAIRSADTRYFVDPSIATAALGLGPEDPMNDLEIFGLLFETLCVRDLRVFSQALDGEVYHYRDKSGLECDAVVHLRNGSYGLIKIKLGGDWLIDEGSKILRNHRVAITGISTSWRLWRIIGGYNCNRNTLKSTTIMRVPIVDINK